MKSIRIAGLCFVAVFAMGMVAAGTASAGVWEHCETEKANAAVSKWTTDQCRTTASQANAGFSWQEVNGTEAVRGHGSLVLTDTKTPIVGNVSVQCSSEGRGTVGPGNHDRIEEIVNIICSPGENCEKIENGGKAIPENLPWQTEVVQEGTERRDTIKSTITGKEAGWTVSCKVLGITKANTCLNNTGSASLKNVLTAGVSGELLVLATFDAGSTNAKCTVGGAGAGRVRGAIANLQANGQGLRVS